MMRHILKTMKNVTAAKFELAFTRCLNNLKTLGNLTVNNSLQDFGTKEMYLHSKNRSVAFQKHRKMFCFHHSSVHRMMFPKCTGYSSVFKIYRFQNVPAKNVPFSCEREAYRSHFSPFQNVPASCERCLRSEVSNSRRLEILIAAVKVHGC